MPASECLIPNKKVLAAAGLVFVAAFVLYFLTLAPTVTLVDSGELILAAYGLGVAHPPGFPLYLVLAHIASLIPIGTVAVRIHAASALFGALAAAVMTLLAAELLWARRGSKKGAADDGDGQRSIAAIAPAVFAGLLLAFSRTLWAYSTVAEVYTLNTLLIVTILWLMFAWRRGLERGDRSYRSLYVAALVFGLAMGVHHVTVAFFLPSLAVLAYAAYGRKFFLSKQFLFAAAIAALGLGIYAYLPLAASRSPLMNWGDPQTWSAVWAHVSGKQYQLLFGFDAARVAGHGWFIVREWGPWAMPFVLGLAVVGFADRFKNDRPAFLVFVLPIAIDLVYTSVYKLAEDRDAYYLPTFICLTIAAAYGARQVARWLGERKPQLKPAYIAAALLAVTVMALVSNFSHNDRRRYFIAQDYVENIQASVEPGGLVLTSDWQPYAPSLYFREVEGRRRDIVFIDTNLLRRTWYFGYLQQAYPEAMARSGGRISAFWGDLRSWARDPGSAPRGQSLEQRVNARFQETLFALITDQLKIGPAYLTLDLADPTASKEPGLVRLLQERYDLVPQGLVFRIVEKGSATVPLTPSINTRGLNDGTIVYDDDDIVRRSVIPTYINMLTRTGLYLQSRGMRDRAVTYLQQALSLDPGYDPAQKGLALSQAASPK